ncbi:hypothetical protein L596_008609 [Steinernema carpocapsae]|uniref:Uncharacterized protein n=1 Tax=Steinernema carpocapsae TaxID=34508 RepID=A0A4U5PD43_STECR|nr:hypothetical protein L596_008609 [Steinernema carpocapsae]
MHIPNYSFQIPTAFPNYRMLMKSPRETICRLKVSEIGKRDDKEAGGTCLESLPRKDAASQPRDQNLPGAVGRRKPSDSVFEKMMKTEKKEQKTMCCQAKSEPDRRRTFGVIPLHRSPKRPLFYRTQKMQINRSRNQKAH